MSHLIRSKVALCVGMAAAVMLLVGATDAAAQFGDGGMGLATHKAKAAQALHAKEVAKELGISDELTEKLVTAYVTSRSGCRADKTSMGRCDVHDARQEATNTEQSKLEIALKEFLREKQAAKAIVSLGECRAQWDRMVDVLAGLNLADDKLYEALPLVRHYVLNVDKALAISRKARAEGIGNQDFRHAGEARKEYRAKLDAGLRQILSSEQFAQWKRSAPAGGGGMGNRAHVVSDR